ncbi:hypothetical protein Tco_0241675 [Tanacetum coccineum]
MAAHSDPLFSHCFDDKADGNELYYRLATRVGAYCEQGIGAVVSGCVFHLVSPSDEFENYFGRRVKELLSGIVTCYDGFVGLVDVLLKEDVIDATLAATLRHGARNRCVRTGNQNCEFHCYSIWENSLITVEKGTR